MTCQDHIKLSDNLRPTFYSKFHAHSLKPNSLKNSNLKTLLLVLGSLYKPNLKCGHLSSY